MRFQWYITFLWWFEALLDRFSQHSVYMNFWISEQGDAVKNLKYRKMISKVLPDSMHVVFFLDQTTVCTNHLLVVMLYLGENLSRCTCMICWHCQKQNASWSLLYQIIIKEKSFNTFLHISVKNWQELLISMQ